MANDYYDFNPSATTWVLLLTGIVAFVVGLCVLLIWAIARAEANSVGRPHLVPRGAAGVPVEAKRETVQAVKPAQAPRFSAATHRHA